MKKIVILLIPLMIACSGTEENADAINFEDFAGETGEEIIDSVVEIIVEDFDQLTDVSKLIRVMNTAYDTTLETGSNPLDRFGFSTSQKVKFRGVNEVPYGKSNMVYPTADLAYYTFSDTIKTKNAFYNYLDGIAEEGESGPVKINQDVESIKMAPMYMLVYDTVIISVNYQCEHAKNDWDSFQDSILSIFGKKYNYQIEVGCGGPLTWGK